MSELCEGAALPVLDVRGTAPTRRVLVVEDEALVALMMADQLAELGCSVIGPAFSISEARRLANVASIDAALVDLNLQGILADEIADILARREIPFHLVTGYSDPPPARYKNVEVLHKPFQQNDLRLAVEGMLVKSVGRRSPYGGAEKQT
jgi:CheY-like chemotaxis protein